ncbi:MAG TPA: sialidase family protein [Polyangiaceae bacterium]|nr:sialidase family protein [Polyangiaceae bacterium]
MTGFDVRPLALLAALAAVTPACGSHSPKAANLSPEEAGGQAASPDAGPPGAAGASAVAGLPDTAGGGTGDAHAPVDVKCEGDLSLPANAPALKVDEWVAVNPVGFPFDPDTSTLGVALHPCKPGVIYLCTGSYDTSIGGLYRSDDAGASWSRVGAVPPDWSGADHLQAPLHVRIDPADPEHLYVAQGVRGRVGFWESMDGGRNLTEPAGFTALNATKELTAEDVYDIAVDPTNFAHVLLVFHSAWGWTDTKWNTNSGVLETTDAGTTWIVHEPMPTWGTGHTIAFLFDAELGIGDPDTWLLSTQGDGRWRTEDAGKTWQKVTDTGIQHGGGTVYYDKQNEYLYASGSPSNQRSKDNGATWENIGDSGGYNAIFGDGERLYTAPVFGPTFLVSPESDGVTWTPFTASQTFAQGPFDWAFDAHNRIVYASNWRAGLWALKLP